MIFSDYIKPEFLVLIPVLWFVGWMIKQSRLKDFLIPFILTAVAGVLCALYSFATQDISGAKDVFMCIFISFTQGAIAAACAVFGNQVIKQSEEILDNEKKQ